MDLLSPLLKWQIASSSHLISDKTSSLGACFDGERECGCVSGDRECGCVSGGVGVSVGRGSVDMCRRTAVSGGR